MKLSIITINYNNSENTINLLESLRNQTNKDFDIIVVDNNSNDIEKLMDYKTTETNIVYIKNDRNLGFSGGNNIGVYRALSLDGTRDRQNGADWVLLLNNDTIPESHLIEYLRADLDPSAGSGQRAREGVVGLALDEGLRVAYVGQIRWLKPTLIHITTPRVVMNKSMDKLYAIGGAMLIHKNVFDKIGFLDENYFLYFEDADFSLRAHKAGIPMSFLNETKIHHYISASTKKLGSPMLFRYHYRNALYFNLKNGPWYIKLLVWPWSWWIIFKQVVKIVAGINKEDSLAILEGVEDWYSDKMGKIKTGT